MSISRPDLHWRRRSLLRALCAAGTTVLAMAPARPLRAAPRSVGAFGVDTWAALRAEAEQRRRPLLLVFSATWCAVCPEVVTQLAHDPRRKRAGAELVVVVADVAPGEADARLMASPHYRLADRLLAFDGNAAAIRHRVHRQWRGMSPSVAWLAPGQPPQFVQGAPTEAELARWFSGAPAARP